MKLPEDMVNNEYVGLIFVSYQLLLYIFLCILSVWPGAAGKAWDIVSQLVLGRGASSGSCGLPVVRLVCRMRGG